MKHLQDIKVKFSEPGQPMVSTGCWSSSWRGGGGGGGSEGVESRQDIHTRHTRVLGDLSETLPED